MTRVLVVVGALVALPSSIAIGFDDFYGFADTQILLQLDARAELATSPPHYPSPWMNPQAPGWEDAYKQARDFVSRMTLAEKVNLTTGTG